VLITGASFGIGRALAVRLGRSGARLLLVARSREALDETVREITAAGGEARAVCLDLKDPSAIDRFCADLAAEKAQIEIVVHNAGKSIRRLVTESLDRPHDLERLMAVNCLGPARLQLALLPAMIARGTGHIINVSSLGVRLPAAPRWGAYTASKGAFDHWLRAASPELRRRGIFCTSVYLGLVHTRMSAPTESYRELPGLTPDEAALVVCRAIVRRPRCVEPWWLAPARWFAPWCGGAVETAWRLVLPAPGGRLPGGETKK
ncbi:MAG: SDR family NAD(P)-dependent oxidoreductase, partial [Chthoniobacterales bacterium]